MNPLYTPFCTMIRLVAVQRWPVVPKPPQSPPSMARSRLASSRTIMGFFPPSSSEQCLKLLAAVCPTMRPTADDPVSEMARTSECSVSGVPTSGPNPVTLLLTPCGTPAFASAFFFALNQNLGGLEDQLGATGRGDQAPPGEGALGCVHSGIHVGLAGFLEDANYVAGVGGIAVFESLSGGRLDPFAVDEVLVNLGRISVANRCRRGQSFGCHDCLLDECRSIDATAGSGGAARERALGALGYRLFASLRLEVGLRGLLDPGWWWPPAGWVNAWVIRGKFHS